MGNFVIITKANQKKVVKCLENKSIIIKDEENSVENNGIIIKDKKPFGIGKDDSGVIIDNNMVTLFFNDSKTLENAIKEINKLGEGYICNSSNTKWKNIK